MPQPATSSDHRRIRRNRYILAAGEWLVSADVALGRADAAVAHASVAGRFASQYHPGAFRSLRLERMLARVGHRVPTLATERSPVGSDGPRNILHVVSRTVSTGGHSRWVERLVRAEPHRRHSLVVTSPRSDDPPASLVEAVAATGGDIGPLAWGGQDWCVGATRLRALAARSELVVLSSDPGDPLPSVAFARGEGRPPVVRLNHADHLFWLGLGVTDLLVDFRPVGARISAERRGVPASRMARLPLPVDAPVALPIEQARRALGIAPEAFVVLSVGAPYKFEPFDGLGFLDLIEPALTHLPELTVVAVGPQPDPRWSAAVSRFGPRLRLFPPTPDLSPHWSAADVFMNPYPVGSDTLMWEAAAAGLVLVSMDPGDRELALVRSDPQEFGHAVVAPSDADDLVAALARLQASPAERRTLAELARKTVAPRLGSSWAGGLPHLWDQATSLRAMRISELQPVMGPGDVDLAVSSWSSTESPWARAVQASYRRLLRQVPTGTTPHEVPACEVRAR